MAIDVASVRYVRYVEPIVLADATPSDAFDIRFEPGATEAIGYITPPEFLIDMPLDVGCFHIDDATALGIASPATATTPMACITHCINMNS